MPFVNLTPMEAYYSTIEPLERYALLEALDAEGKEENASRRLLWEKRYPEEKGQRPDKYMQLWMLLEFNKSTGNRFLGARSARKEIRKSLEALEFDTLSRDEKTRELLYQECCQLVRAYIALCREDRTYNSVIMGIVPMKKEQARKKLKTDLYETAVALPKLLKMEEDLSLITQAAAAVYEETFPDEGSLVTEQY